MCHRYITKRQLKHTKCEVCKSSLQVAKGKSSNPAADLVNLKTRGFLTHVNQNLFQIIQVLEVCFLKHAGSANPFDDTFEEFFSTENLKLCFPCVDHKTEVLTDICVMYITMRMRQYSWLKNQETKKINKTKKKLLN